MSAIRRAVAVVLVLFAITPGLYAAGKRRAINPVDTITIIQTTDIHDHANGSGHNGLDVDPATAMSVTGAYARIAAYVRSVRSSTSHPVIVVDSGDWTMGTLYDLTLGSNPLALYFLNAIKYDATTLGNHEFDYTPAGLAQMLSAARTAFNFSVPIVASNMSLNGNTTLAPLFGAGKLIQPSYVEQLPNGLRVGYIGLMGEDAALDASAAAAPVTFAQLSTHYSDIQAIVDDLRNNQHAQIVIALSHSGTDASGTSGEDVNLARNVHGINVIASGHTHTPLSAVHAVANGTWTTQIIDAGAFGTNVARLDLRVDRGNGTVTPLGYSNTTMTNANLASLGIAPDAATVGLVNAIDKQLNSKLGPVLTALFSDYDPANLARGIYHPVAAAAQDMRPNDINLVLAPNGLGDLAADAVRTAPNALITATLTRIGGNPANLPGYDFTPVQLGVVATGVIRQSIQGNVPLTFTDIYNVLPLGISPDSTQALPVGYPLISAYVDVNDVKKVAALQLVGKSNLIGSSFYLNFSGIRYSLKTAESYTYFKYATAAAVLQVANDKASAGSTSAQQAIGAVFAMFSDQGASLLAASAAGNPYAKALVNLNDANPDASQTAANLAALGDVGGTALRGLAAVSALVVSKAVAAIDTISGFAPTDSENTGSTTDLTPGTRIRVSADLYAILLLNAVESQYGIKITPYQSATGATVLSSADMATLLGNRIDFDTRTPAVEELKEWMALLAYTQLLEGTIGPEYASTPNFADFPTFGAAVKTRESTSYPLASIAQLVTTMATLKNAP